MLSSDEIMNIEASVVSMSADLRVMYGIKVSENVEVEGNVQASYLIGDGSQITNIDASNIQDITTTQILDETLLAEDISEGAIDTSEILNGAIVDEDISDTAAIAFEKLDITDVDIRGLSSYSAGTGLQYNASTGEFSTQQNLSLIHI